MRLPGAVPLPGPHRAYGLQYDRTGFSVAANAPLLARAPLPTIVEGVVCQYKALGIPPARLVVGIPWYAYDFTCAGHARPRHTRVICLPAPSPTQTGSRTLRGAVHRRLGYVRAGAGPARGIRLASHQLQRDDGHKVVRLRQRHHNAAARRVVRRPRDWTETLLLKYTALLKLGWQGWAPGPRMLCIVPIQLTLQPQPQPCELLWRVPCHTEQHQETTKIHASTKKQPTTPATFCTTSAV